MASDLSALAPYASDPDVVAYLQKLYADSQQQQQQPDISSLLDAGLTSAYGTADTNYANTIAAIDAQQPGIQRTYGYDANGNVDASNPFGRAQLLQRSYQQSQKGNNNQYAARGQLYSGALQRAQNDAQFNYQANDAALRNDYGQQMAALSAQRAVAQNTRDSAKSSAYWDFINAQIAARAAGYGTGTSTDSGAAAGSDAAAVSYGPDGTVLDPAAVSLAQGTGGTPGPAAPASDGSFASYANNPAVVAYLQSLYQASLPKIVQLPQLQQIGTSNKNGTGGARYPG